MSEALEDERRVLSAEGYHAKAGAPPTLTLGRRGTGKTRRVGETVLSLVTGGCPLNKVRPRTWAAFQTRRAFTLAAFNRRVPWQGLKPDSTGLIRLSLAEFSL